MSAEPIVTCPNCKTDFKLTESLAAPVVDAIRVEYERKFTQQATEFAKREHAVKAREESLAKEKESVDATIAEALMQERAKLTADAAKCEQAFKDREAALAKERENLDATAAEKVKAERAKIAADEQRKAKLALGEALDAKTNELTELAGVLKAKDEKLAEAVKAQVELAKKSRELDDAKREMDLTIEQRITESLGKTREQAKKEAEEQISLKLTEKEVQISSLQRSLEEMKKKIEQGSQQLQGEALELQLESILGGKFPHDRIEPVPKGEFGGDILHRVVTPNGVACGTILWESKRVKNWSDAWLGKLRGDQRAAKAEVAIIVSAVLPKGVETFEQIDEIWVVHPRAILPVAMCLRQLLIEVNCARQAGEGQQTKMELVYRYLTGPKFRLRVGAIVDAFSDMSDDLQKEKKVTTKQWAKREQQIAQVLEATAGMYGELQGIAGKSLGEIEGLDLEALPEPIETRGMTT